MPRSKTLRRDAKGLRAIVAQNVLLHRQRLGLTQEELADKCGFHRTYIGSVERGERNITLATIEALAGTFGVEPSVLLARVDG
jgi:transcriptional regulator with XRE-family HTH domain